MAYLNGVLPWHVVLGIFLAAVDSLSFGRRSQIINGLTGDPLSVFHLDGGIGRARQNRDRRGNRHGSGAKGRLRGL